MISTSLVIVIAFICVVCGFMVGLLVGNGMSDKDVL